MEQLRNIVLLGHGSCGKTSLGEAMLFDTGATTRLGTVESKNTVSDFEDEEQARGFSVSTAILPAEWRKHQITILDAPGYTDFVGEVKAAIRAADGAVLVVCAASGVEVGAELHWSFLEDSLAHRLVFINKMDRDNASFENALEDLRTKFDKTFVPVAIPIGSQSGFRGVIDLIGMKAYLDPKSQGTDIPADIQERAEEARIEMMEYAAEVDDELMIKYLDGEELTDQEIRTALAQGVAEGSLVLVLAGSATKNLGVVPLLDAVASFMPKPSDVEREAVNLATEESEVIDQSANAPLIVQVFKTLADPFVGKLSYLRVFGGTLESDSRVLNVREDEEERLGQLYSIRGKEQTPVDALRAGELGAVARLNVTATGDTLCDRGAPYRLPDVIYPEPLYSVAIFPKTQADLDKMSAGLARLVDEDPTLRVERNTETNETILSGMGDSHIQLATRRLAQKFSVEVDTDLPKIAYRETITKTAQAQGRHKKQSGGRGQFGDVYCRFEPMERGEGFEFVSEVFGGSVPRQYIPAVEKGIREAMEEGILAGYPTVDFRCALYDGSSHPVDSSELAFKLAAHLAFRNAVPQAGPVLLEPVYKVRVTVPEEFMGDIMGDLNTRRAQIQGMEQARGNGIISAIVPLAEIQRYATDLRSMTQGRGIYAMEFSHYDIVPSHLVDTIKAEAQRRAERQNGD